MKLIKTETHVVLILDGAETSDWANNPAARWPCSALSGRSLRAEFDKGGLVDMEVGRLPGDPEPAEGESSEPVEVLSDEFNAITCDFLKENLPSDHPCWLVTVGQFQDKEDPAPRRP
jgi:hypothetical protein